MKPEQQITTAHLVTRKHLVGRLRKAPNAKAQQHLKNSTSSSSSQSGGKSNSNSFSSNNNNNVNKKSISKQGMSSADWRRYGIEYRRQLLEQDEQEGGSKFDLNYQCRIQGYFALSEKVCLRFVILIVLIKLIYTVRGGTSFFVFVPNRKPTSHALIRVCLFLADYDPVQQLFCRRM